MSRGVKAVSFGIIWVCKTIAWMGALSMCWRCVEMSSKKNKTGIEAVDLFCGGGGFTCGLQQNGIDVKMGIDYDSRLEYAYEHNNAAEFWGESVRKVHGEDLIPLYGKGCIKLLAGCPPCQTFSKYNQKASHYDQRWNLVGQFRRLVGEVNPDLIALENVPFFAETRVFDTFKKYLEKNGYFVDYKIVKCPEYGLPQMRQRVILLGSRFGEIKVPEPTHKPPQTVRELIYDLPHLRAGKCDPNDRLHFCAALSPLNMKRMKKSKPGGSWRDWPEELVAECHKRDTGKTYGGVYGRMEWDKPAPTMTTQFYGFGNGRFGHPEQNRAISIREGAIFQGFPRGYQFLPPDQKHNISLLGKMIGNAVPVGLGKIVGKAIVEHVAKNRPVKEV